MTTRLNRINRTLYDLSSLGMRTSRSPGARGFGMIMTLVAGIGCHGADGVDGVQGIWAPTDGY